jgi:hypothetical protein
LPLAPFTAEEYAYTTAPRVHTALGTVESYVPALFALLHLGVAIFDFLGG